MNVFRLDRPVRCALERYDDMVTSGMRHPFLSHYKVAFDKQGHIQAYKADLFSNGGHTLDLSGGVLGKPVLCYICYHHAEIIFQNML